MPRHETVNQQCYSCYLREARPVRVLAPAGGRELPVVPQPARLLAHVPAEREGAQRLPGLPRLVPPPWLVLRRTACLGNPVGNAELDAREHAVHCAVVQSTATTRCTAATRRPAAASSSFADRRDAVRRNLLSVGIAGLFAAAPAGARTSGKQWATQGRSRWA